MNKKVRILITLERSIKNPNFIYERSRLMATRKFHNSYTVVFFFVLFLAINSSGANAYQNDPDGFRAFAWQTSKDSFDGLVVQEKYGGYVDYIKKNEDLDFEGKQATRILYGFTDNRLETVTVQFEPPNEDRYASLKNKLIAKYGVGEPIGQKDLFWRGGKTNIKLGVYGDGVEIIYSDNKTFSRRMTTIDEFNKRFKDEWNKLLETNVAAIATTKIKQWLDREGENILDSYQLSRNGEQISLNFKGGETYLIFPAPLNIKQTEESKNAYSVKEVVKILNLSPERFKGKDIFLRAEVVDGVMGFGCNDYLMLTDPEFVDLYKRKYDRDLTDEEREAIKNIPIILFGPSLSMPKGIASMAVEGVYRGHFFDNSMKSCKDGWKRFVITDRK